MKNGSQPANRLLDAVVLTLDVDWAPDFAIDDAASILVHHGVRATWYVTHASRAIDRLREHPDLFELGIHPNFLPGSTHGASSQSVLETCMRIVPEARSIRTHALVQSSPLLQQVVESTPIDTDTSLFLPYASFITPVELPLQGRTLMRVPYFWEDDTELGRGDSSWDAASIMSRGQGLKVFDFHPIHVYLNSATMGPYEDLKARAPALERARLGQAVLDVNEGTGARSLFRALVDQCAAQERTWTVGEIGRAWAESRAR